MEVTTLKERIENKNKNLELSISPPFPKKNFLIELSNICNDSCIFCANRKMTRKRGYITDNVFYKVVDEAYALGAREVGFYTTGEPFIHPKLETYIRYCKREDQRYEYTYITTNGALATPQRMSQIIDAGLDSIKFSINAITRESYNLIHGRDDFNLVMDNLKNIYKYKKKSSHKFNIYVSFIKTKFTNNTDKEINDFFIDYCDSTITAEVKNQCGLMPEIQSLLSIDNVSMNKSLKLPCTLPFNTLNISHEGYITACCADFQNYLAFDDISKTPLKEAWDNDIIKKFRQKHMDQNVTNTICNNCIGNSYIKPLPLVSHLSSDFTESLFYDRKAEMRIDEFLNKN